jgi:hypothetical protein
MGNAQQAAEGGRTLQDEYGDANGGGGDSGSATASAAKRSANRRKSMALSVDGNEEAVIDLDGDFVQTGKARKRRPTAASLLGRRGDDAEAAAKKRQSSGSSGGKGHDRGRGSVIPQQVVKFERAIIQSGNVFEDMEEELVALLERESPSVPQHVKSSAGIPLPKPIGRGQLARQHVVYGANYFPVHVPKYHDTCDAKEQSNLQVLKINKGGLTLYQGYHFSSFEWSSALTVLKQEKLEKKLGNVIQHFPMRYLSQWRVMENHFSWRYHKPAPPGGQPSQSGYTVESCEVASIGKTLEAYVAALMRDMNMPTDGVFNPQIEAYNSAQVRGDGAAHVRRGTAVGRSELGLASTPEKGKKRGKRGSTFTMESPLRKGTSPKSAEPASGAGAGAPKGIMGKLTRGKSGRARKRASLAALMGGVGEHDKKLDHGIVVISGVMQRRAGGLMGYGKSMTDKFYVLYRTSQGHYLAEFREGQKAACLPDNPRESWRWPKNFIDLSTTLRVYSPSIADPDTAGPLSMDIITPSRIWTFRFDHEKVMGKWIRRISAAVQADALIVPDQHFEYACDLHKRLPDRDVYGDRKLKRLGEAQVILKALSMEIRFNSTRIKDLSFKYWELMSWRGLRRQSTGALHLALRCVKNMEIIELEIGCYQLEAIDLLEAHIMLFTSKLSAGVHQLNSSQAKPPKGKPPPQRGKGGKPAPPKSKAPQARKKGPAPKPPGSSKPKPKPAKAKKPLIKQGKSKPPAGANPPAPDTSGAVGQAMHAAGNSGKKKKLIKKGKSKKPTGGTGN